MKRTLSLLSVLIITASLSAQEIVELGTEQFDISERTLTVYAQNLPEAYHEYFVPRYLKNILELQQYMPAHNVTVRMAATSDFFLVYVIFPSFSRSGPGYHLLHKDRSAGAGSLRREGLMKIYYDDAMKYVASVRQWLELSVESMTDQMRSWIRDHHLRYLLVYQREPGYELFLPFRYQNGYLLETPILQQENTQIPISISPQHRHELDHVYMIVPLPTHPITEEPNESGQTLDRFLSD